MKPNRGDALPLEVLLLVLSVASGSCRIACFATACLLRLQDCRELEGRGNDGKGGTLTENLRRHYLHKTFAAAWLLTNKRALSCMQPYVPRKRSALCEGLFETYPVCRESEFNISDSKHLEPCRRLNKGT